MGGGGSPEPFGHAPAAEPPRSAPVPPQPVGAGSNLTGGPGRRGAGRLEAAPPASGAEVGPQGVGGSDGPARFGTGPTGRETARRSRALAGLARSASHRLRLCPKRQAGPRPPHASWCAVQPRRVGRAARPGEAGRGDAEGLRERNNSQGRRHCWGPTQLVGWVLGGLSTTGKLLLKRPACCGKACSPKPAPACLGAGLGSFLR